jgi:hypothetical protein
MATADVTPGPHWLRMFNPLIPYLLVDYPLSLAQVEWLELRHPRPGPGRSKFALRAHIFMLDVYILPP